jgi:hypothetical protein
VTAGEQPGYEGTASAWARHLRGAGTTPWLEFCSTRPPDPQPRDLGAAVTAATPRGLPGAAQLELVRRLAVRADRADRSQATPAEAAFAALADRVLARPAPGRGAADRPLVWPDDPSAPDDRRGAPSVDPASLGAGELLRLGAGLVVDLLLAGPVPDSGEADGLAAWAGARLRAWARMRTGAAYRVVGAPTGAAAVRAVLAAAGHPEGGREQKAQVFVVLDGIDSLLADAWALRVRRGSPTRWRTFVGARAARDLLPSSAALDEVAAFWAERVGPERTHLVVGAATAPATVAAVLGVPASAVIQPGLDRRVAGPLPPAATDVVRRVNAALRVRVPPDARSPLVDRLVTVLSWAPPPPGPGGLRVPNRHRHWAAAAGRRVARRLADGGYIVHGDLGVLGRPGAGAPGPRATVVLETMLDAVLVLAGVVPAEGPQAQGGRR